MNTFLHRTASALLVASSAFVVSAAFFALFLVLGLTAPA